ncbi:MAG: hypothetical protein KF876_08120 [Nitrospira sp.]|nr:hypothetical protein [Nitrospira sp.]
MARARAAEQQRSRSKTTPLEEITLGITKFQEVVATIHDISQEGFPYRDAAQSKAELQFRECLRQTFGERSQEFQTHRNFKIRTADKADVARSLAVITGLIHTLEDRKLELQGLKPVPKPEPPPEAPLNNTARMALVPPTLPSTTQAAPPMTFETAMLKDTKPSSAPATPISHAQPPDPNPFTPTPIPNHTATVEPVSTPPLTPISLPTPTVVPITPVAAPVGAPTPSPLPTPAPPPAAQPTLSMSPPPVEAAPAQPGPVPTQPVSAISIQPNVNVPAPAAPSPPTRAEAHFSLASTPQDPSSDKNSTGLTGPPLRSMEPGVDQDPLQLVRKVCLRLHSVARQLRLRRDYRPTLEIEDDHDLQDLLCALLKMEFDEVATEEWTPPYTEGTPRTMLLINRDQIAVVAKKTRSGLSAKELADQITADSAYYRAQGRGSALFCFMYDPEGRIGSPKRLETTLTSVSEHCRVEVLVAPK